MKELKLEDYVRLTNTSHTVAREFEAFKEHFFNRTLSWEGRKVPIVMCNLNGGGRLPLWGIKYEHTTQTFKHFDRFTNITYEQAAAVAYTKYYRAISAFILPLEARLVYFDLSYHIGPNRAIKIMQRCAGVPEDGIIGPATREKMLDITVESLHAQRSTLFNIAARRLYQARKMYKRMMILL